jgi:hypothetical protein
MSYGFSINPWKAEAEANTATATAGTKTLDAKAKEDIAAAEVSSAEQRYQAYLEELETRKRLQAEHQQQAELARKFEQGKRSGVGMASDALNVLYNTQEQLAEEQLAIIKENVDTEQQGGVADLKIPWKSLGLFAVAGIGVWYWRK